MALNRPRQARILTEDTLAVVVDVQDRLFPHIHAGEALLHNLHILTKGLQALAVPLLVTEQYTKGLGATLEPLKQSLGEAYQPIEKMAFSCLDEPEFARQLRDSERNTVLLMGVEAHVCVLQTAVDLLDHGYRPVVVVNGISSRKAEDKAIALDRFRKLGLTLTSYESILLELCRVSGTAPFKTISRLIK